MPHLNIGHWHPDAALIPNPTQEEARVNPIGLLQGVAADGVRSQQLKVNSGVLFDEYTGAEVLALTAPPNFNAPSPQEFMNWHSYFQQQYLAGQTPVPITDNGETFDVHYASIGGNADPLRNANMVLSQDGTRIIDLNSLQLSDIATLSLNDQRALSGLALFRETYALQLGLVPNSTVRDATQERERIFAQIDIVISDIESADDFQPNMWTTFNDDPLQRANLYHYLLLGQLSYLKARLAKMAIFSPDQIKSQFAEIRDRFLRLNEFKLMTMETAVATNGLRQSLNALDEFASVRSAQDILIGTELKLFELTKSAFDVADTGYFEDPLRPGLNKVLDAPNLVFVLQTFESYSKEAEAEALTEEMNQVNRLLQNYTAMQRLINATLNKFDPVDADPDNPEKLGLKGNSGSLATFMGLPATSENRISAEEVKTISMFDKLSAFANDNTFHPMENRNGIIRPTEDMVNVVGFLNTYTKETWDKFAISLSEATKLLNQDSQVRMDRIGRFNREKNRSYELATGTLTRLSDILRSIIN